MLINAGTLIIEVGMWYLALKSLKKTGESIKDTNDQNEVSNQRDRWKVSLSAYRKLMKISNQYSAKFSKSRNNKEFVKFELRFFSFIVSWSKEYILYTNLADKIFIKRCVGSQLKIIYDYYTKFLGNVPGYRNDISLFKKALNRCDIL